MPDENCLILHCRHGWNRTGRLAAYYRIRYGGSSAEDARHEMHEIGAPSGRFAPDVCGPR